MKKKLIAGNWKMNGSLTANQALLQELLAGLANPVCEGAVCAPAVYLAQLQSLLKDTPVAVGVQDVSAHGSGAYKGEISATRLRDLGGVFALVLNRLAE